MGASLLAVTLALLALQEPGAIVSGQVRDAGSGAPLAGATVVLADLGLATTTDDAGRYLFRGVPAGPQHLAVRLVGHAPRTLHALVPATGRLTLDITLRARAITLATVEVRSPLRIPGLEPGQVRGFPDRELSAAAIRQHPQLAEPDAFQALSGAEVVIRPEAPGGVHIRGGATDHTGFLLDGVPVLSPYHAAGVFSAWNPEALATVGLAAAEPPLDAPGALAGVVAGGTRVPADRLGMQGSFSTTQLRLALDGPLIGGAGFLLALRRGFPGILAPEDEPSYVQGETGDLLGKVEFGAAGGRARVLGYLAGNDLDAAAVTAEVPVDEVPRHRFDWRSASAGISWRRAFGTAAARFLVWHARSDADADWAAEPAAVLQAERRDLGGVAVLELSPAGPTRGEAGLRLERIETDYASRTDTVGATTFRLDAVTPVVTGFAQVTRLLGNRGEVSLGAALATGDGELHPAGRAGVRWHFSGTLQASASYARTHQFAQSLRHAESVVGTLFPADLFVGAAAPGVPLAQGHQLVAALEYRPQAAVRAGFQAWARDFDGLVLVAPGGGGPFALGEFATGRGQSWGTALDFAVATSRVGLLASWAMQQVEFKWADADYTPEQGTRHLLEAGATWHPTATTSLRLGAAAAFGRRATTATGSFEWESCNLLDEGCEFGGSPGYDGSGLGGTALPGYVRADLGARQHWHMRLGGRDVQVTLFATATNLLGHTNVLTYVRDPDTDRVSPVELRPLAPLVVGLDWRF